MKKILLINPDWPGQISRKGKRFNRAWPPLSLMVCAAMLREEGLETQIIDGRVDNAVLLEVLTDEGVGTLIRSH